MIHDRVVCLLTGHRWHTVRRTGSHVVVCLRCGRPTDRERLRSSPGPGEDVGDDIRGQD